MTVKELRAALRDVDDDAPVVIQSWEATGRYTMRDVESADDLPPEDHVVPGGRVLVIYTNEESDYSPSEF